MYKRRVTVFTKKSNHKDKENIANAEYQGLCKFKKIPHDNSTSVPYVPTDPALLKEAARITIEKHQKLLKTSHQMMLNDSINVPNAKQSRDKVYRDTKKPTTANPHYTTSRMRC